MKTAIVYSLLILSLFFVFSSCEKDIDEVSTLDEQIAQMLLVGFRGTTLTTENHIYRDIKDYKIGGVIIFEKDGPSQSRPRNIESKEQLAKLISDLKNLSEDKLFVAIDQEGGIVCRLKTDYGYPATVTAQYLGELNSEDSTRYYATKTALTLKEAGLNLNFAPVVDLNINPESPAIGAIGRSFSSNPSSVVFHSSIFIEEHLKLNILTCCKHFPGHGSAMDDSHLGFTDVSNTWSEVELEPYKQLASSGKCKMVMTSHVFNRNLDSIYPATLSEKIVKDILREELNFKGVVVTDAMEMGAIVNNYGLEEAIEKSVNAGCDILLFSNNVKTYDPEIVPSVIRIIKKLIDEDKISRERIRESYDRIVSLKDNL